MTPIRLAIALGLPLLAAACGAGAIDDGQVTLDRDLHDTGLYHYQGPLIGRNDAVRNLATTQPEPYD